jgi:hypothetical protein
MSLFAVTMLLSSVSGCASTSDAAATLRTGSSADETTCLKAVAAQTGNTVTILSSDFSQAATEVMVGVGAGKAPWRCLISGGKVQEITSMTNEGAM